MDDLNFDKITKAEILRIVQENEVLRNALDIQNDVQMDQTAFLKSLVENMLDLIALTDPEGNFIYAGKSHQIMGYEPALLVGKNVMDFVHPDDLPHVLSQFKAFMASGNTRTVIYRNRCKDGSYIWLETMGNLLKDTNGIPKKIVFSSRDITQRRVAEDRLKRIEWMLNPPCGPSLHSEKHIAPVYGDLSVLNTKRVILNAVGKPVLSDIVSDFLRVLGTSAAVYESNGDYALGFFSSKWCRFMDMASRQLCYTTDNQVALASGKWLCHEFCWGASKICMESGKTVDLECAGGIRLYVAPIYCKDEIIGTINMGYGDPPRDMALLQDLSKKYEVDVLELFENAKAYESRPPFIMEMAKQRLRSAARLIGEIVARKNTETELRESEEKHRRLFETMAQGVVYQRLDGTIISANPASERILGLSFDKMLGKTSFDLRWKMIRGDGSRVSGTEHPAMLALQTGQTVGPVIRDVFSPETNSHIWLSITSIPLFQPGEAAPFQAYSTFEDITEKKLAQDALQENEKKFRRLFESSPISLCELDFSAIKKHIDKIKYQNIGDLDYYFRQQPEIVWELARQVGVLDVNQVALKLFGAYSKEDFSDGITKIISSESLDGIISILLMIAAGEKEKSTKVDHITLDGRSLKVLLYWSAAEGYEENYSRVIVSVVDITEQERIEKTLRYQQELLEGVVNGISDILAIQYPDHTIERYNQAGYELLGLSFEEVKGKKCYELLGRDAECTQCPASQAAAGKKSVNAEKYFPELGLYFNCLSNPVLDDHGNVIKIVQHLRDITEQKKHEQRLLQERDYMFRIFDSMKQYVAVISQDYKYEFINTSMFRILDNTFKSLDRNDTIGKQCYLFTDGRCLCSYCPVPKLLSQADNEALPYTHEAFGKILEGVATKLINLDGSVSILIVLEDVTEQRQAKEALRHHHMRLENIIEGTQVGTWEWDVQTGKAIINEIWAAIVGYTLDELAPFSIEKWQDLVHPKDLTQSSKFLKLHFSGNLPLYEVQVRMKHKEGHWVWVQSRGKVIKWTDDKQPWMMFGTHTDITAQRKAEQDYRTLFHTMYDGFALHEIICDETGMPVDYRFVAVNPAFERIMNLKSEQIIGRTVLELLPSTEKSWIETYGKVALTGEPLSFEDFSAGIDKHLEVTAFSPDQGQFACIFVDITERKQSQKEQEKLQAQLNQAQRMESVGRLAGGVAHDFNNMLSIINGYAEMSIEKLKPSDPLYENVQEIFRAGTRSADIVRQLMAFARQQAISPVQMDLNDTVSSMLKMLHRLIGENIDLAWMPGKNLWLIKMDPSQIDQIMANLTVNARDAISDVGKLTIETRNIQLDQNYCSNFDIIPGQFVMLAVSDNGFGMDDQTKNRLFEPFFTTKGIGEGTGLGLSTVYGIVKQNNGFINVYSEPGEGTTFKIYIPRDHLQQKGPGAEKESIGKAPKGTETILIVEDETVILQMTRAMLERLGYTVLTAAKPKDAIQLVREFKEKIHLLLTDVIMPEMNGRDLSAQMSIFKPEIKILFMSGYTANVIEHHGILDEGVQFIQKPFSYNDLAVKVREILMNKP
jgi:PAS domain S-box-containing protein